jgi:hypothetical protein
MAAAGFNHADLPPDYQGGRSDSDSQGRQTSGREVLPVADQEPERPVGSNGSLADSPPNGTPSADSAHTGGRADGAVGDSNDVSVGGPHDPPESSSAERNGHTVASDGCDGRPPQPVPPPATPPPAGGVWKRLQELQADDIVLLTDEHGGGYADVPDGDHRELFLISSPEHKNWLYRWLLDRKDQDPSAKLVNETVTRWRALAGAPGVPRCELEVRSRWGDRGQRELWIDLCDLQRRMVRVSADGWEVVPSPPGAFRRYPHMRPLPEPDPSGDYRDFLAFARALGTEGDELLLLSYAMLAFVPIQRPILLLTGPPGAGKSTLCGYLQGLIDPCEGLLGQDARASLPLTFFKHLLVTFDNLWQLSPKESDQFCRATTGGAIHWRRLYTDSDSVTFHFKRPVVLAALHPPTDRTDFADRILHLPLARPEVGGYAATSCLDAAFEEARPQLFGGLLNALSRTLALLPRTSRDGLSRLSDFHWYGRAAAEALGGSPADFDEALAEALARQRGLALEDPLAQALLHFAKEHGRTKEGWQGTAHDLRLGLEDVAVRQRIVKGADWPKSDAGLGRRVEVLKEALRSHGVLIERKPRGKERILVVKYVA